MNVFRDQQGFCHHLHVKKGDISPHIITCGSPERVTRIASFLSQPTTLSENRGLRCIRGDYRGILITAVCCGMGPASTAIVLPEVLDSVDAPDNGRVSLVRLGTAGAWQDFVKVGHIVVANSAVRDEGTTEKWIPSAYPSVAGTKISLALLLAGKNSQRTLGQDLWFGPVHAKDELYATEAPKQSPLAASREVILNAFQEMGVLATEMEFSVLTILSDLYNASSPLNIEAGCMLQILSPYGSHDTGGTEFEHPDPDPAIQMALEGLRIKAEWDQGKFEEDPKDILKFL